MPPELKTTIEAAVSRLNSKWITSPRVVVNHNPPNKNGYEPALWVEGGDDTTINLHPNFIPMTEDMMDDDDFLVENYDDAITHEYNHILVNKLLNNSMVEYISFHSKAVSTLQSMGDVSIIEDISGYALEDEFEAMAEAFLRNEKQMSSSDLTPVVLDALKGLRRAAS